MSSKEYTVFYAVDADTQGRTMFLSFDKAERPIIYVQVHKAPCPVTAPGGSQTDRMLARIFHILNGQDDEVSHPEHLRSMSVGDVVLFPSGRAFICAAFGWKVLDEDLCPTKDEPYFVINRSQLPL